jgi:pimeloyl-ACP methyl ester carboxylesterase
MIKNLALPEWSLVTCRLAPMRSEASSADEVLDHYAEQVVTQVDESIAGIQHRLIIVGHSMGAQVAELAARHLGDRVAGLLLVTPAPLMGYPLPSEVMSRFESRAGLTDPSAIAQGKRGLGIALDDDAVDILVRTTLATGRDAALEQLRAWTGGHGTGEQPSPLAVPVLTVTTDDKFFTAEMLVLKATRFQNRSFASIPGAGHWPQLEQPRALAQVLECFVRELPAAD